MGGDPYLEACGDFAFDDCVELLIFFLDLAEPYHGHAAADVYANEGWVHGVCYCHCKSYGAYFAGVYVGHDADGAAFCGFIIDDHPDLREGVLFNVFARCLSYAHDPGICVFSVYLYQNKTSVGVLGMPKTPLNSIRGHISCPNVLTRHLQSNKDFSKPSGSISFTWKSW